jgi:hypothetical protein
MVLAYAKLGPPGLDDARTQLTSGMWFLFVGAYVLAATRPESLGWMVWFFTRKGSSEGETRVRMVLAGGVFAAVGACLLGRGLVLSDCHFDGFAISCTGL